VDAALADLKGVVEVTGPAAGHAVSLKPAS